MYAYIYLWPFFSQKGFQCLQNIHDTERLKNKLNNKKTKTRNEGTKPQARVGMMQIKVGVVSIRNVRCNDGCLCSCWARNSALNFSAANRVIGLTLIEQEKNHS